MAEIVDIDPENPDDRTIERAAGIIRSGGLVAFPTETVYGLGADARNPEALRRIYEAKKRPSNNPLIVHCENVERIRNECVSAWPEAAQKLADAFWPGPLTLILPKSAFVPPEATAGLNFVGVRIPANVVAQALIHAADRPIAAPSANRSNRISPTRAEHVSKDLGEAVAMILDAGPCRAGVESTVLDLTGPIPIILRPGPIGASAISDVLGIPVESANKVSDETSPQRSPGQSHLHYAPRKTLKIVPMTNEEPLDPAVGTLLLGQLPRNRQESNSTGSMFETDNFVIIPDAKIAEQELYSLLHTWDENRNVREIQVIFAVGTDSPEWLAVKDRISRAAGQT